MSIELLLMTWTISPSKDQIYESTSLSSDIRKLQYLKSLIFYITQSNFNKIIFCENSDYKFNKSETDILENLSKLYKKELELLHFKWDFEKTIKLWYWYGEWECIDYAYDNSKILKTTESFYKITGRYIIWNINEIINSHKDKKNFFIRDIPAYFTMNTAFFKMETKLYKDYFYNVKKLVNESIKINYETACYTKLFENNLFDKVEKLTILPKRINCYDDNFTWNIHKYNVMKRPKRWYDYIWIKTWLYRISCSDKFLFSIVTRFTRKKLP